MKMKRIKLATALLCAAVLAGAQSVSAAGSLGNFQSSLQENDMINTPQSMTSSGGEVIALDDQDISIVVGDYTAITQEDNFVYVYTMEENSMPYVIIGYYDIVDDKFTDAFTAYMQSVYSDLQVTQEPYSVNINGNSYSLIAYEYTVQGYSVQDSRLFTVWNNRTYMFGSKEVPALGYMLEDGYLGQVAGSFAPLAGGDSDYEKHVDSRRSARPASAADTIGPPAGGSQSGSGTVSGGTIGGSVGGISGSPKPARTGNETDGSITFGENNANFKGSWVTFDDGFKLYLPDTWRWYELTEEQSAAGMLYLAGDPSDASNAPYINVNYSKSEGLATLDDMAADLTAAGFTVDAKININGIPCVSYASASQDLAGVMFFHPQTTDYLFAVVTAEYSNNVDTQAAILCSLSPAN